ncbi:MAG: cohesin domain-containing protein [bacterium]
MSKLLLILGLTLTGCFRHAPTGVQEPAALALQLRVAKWTLLQPHQEQTLARAHAVAQISRVEIYVAAERDTLTRATVVVDPGANEFSASLEVPAGENRRIIVEAWDDIGSEGQNAAGLILRGIQTNVTVVPEVALTVPLTLYPIPLFGRRVVLAAGSASGVLGSSGNFVPLTLISADSLSGMQFDLNFNPVVIAPQRVVPDAALPWRDVQGNPVNNGQAVRVVMFDSNSQRLPVFYDPATLVNIEFRVNSATTTGASSPLVISNAMVLDANRVQLEVAAVHDTFYVVGGN